MVVFRGWGGENGNRLVRGCKFPVTLMKGAQESNVKHDDYS